jgi:hypothetical protein
MRLIGLREISYTNNVSSSSSSAAAAAAAAAAALQPWVGLGLLRRNTYMYKILCENRREPGIHL